MTPGTYAISVSEVRVGHRLRTQSDVTDLKASMEREGLLNPITVSTEGTLIAGAHRLAAAKALGWTEIQARVLDIDPVRAEVLEIEENLTQHPLTILERGEHLARRSELLRELGLRRKDGAAPINPDNLTGLATTAMIAEAAGVSGRTMRRDVEVASALSEAERNQVRHTPIADNRTELKALGSMEEGLRAEVLPLIESGQARRVADAVRMVRPSEDDEDDDSGYDASDASEKLYPVRLRLTWEFQTASTQTRTRGEKEGTPRESDPFTHEVPFTWPVARRREGRPGLTDAMKEVWQQVFTDEKLATAWARIPAAALREDPAGTEED